MVRTVIYISFFLFILTGNIIIAQTGGDNLTRHTVESKETLYSISREYGVTIDELMQVNKGLTASLKVGQVIVIPARENVDNYVTFYVSSTTTLAKVAELYQVPESVLTEINPGLKSKLFPGQEVLIPVGDKAFQQNEIETPVVTEPVNDNSNNDRLEKKQCYDLRPNYKKEYKVAVMIPLYLEKYDSIQKKQFLASEKNDFAPFRFIGFYEGALMAVDSLTKLGMKVRLYVYDVTDNVAKTNALVQNAELREMDLIIGPFLNKSFDIVARFAGEHNIPIVNPFSFRNEILKNYKTTIKTKPGTAFQSKQVVQLIEDFFPDSKVFLISQSSKLNDPDFALLQQSLAENISKSYKISNQDLLEFASKIIGEDGYKKGIRLPAFKLEGINVDPAFLELRPSDSMVFNNSPLTINYSADSLNSFLKYASNIRTSLVIIHSDNKSFAMDVMNRLNPYRDTLKITIIGLPSWEKFSNLDNKQCNDMNLTYLSTLFTDFSDRRTEKFNYQFREKYSIEPGEYAFAGYDLTYFFLNALFRFDSQFYNCLDQQFMELFQSGYHFQNVGNFSNFENSYWNVIQYQNYQLIKLNSSTGY